MKILAVGNGHACDSDHPRMPFMSLSWVDPSLSLVPRRDECVRHGMRGMMSGDSVCWMKYTRYANLAGKIKPPESTIDRVLFQ